MEHVVLTQLTIPEIRALFRQELESYFQSHNPEPANPAADEVLNIEQAAVLVGLAVPTVYRLVSQSDIPYSKRRKRLYFSKQELTEWIKAGRRKTVDEIAQETAITVSKKGGRHGAKR